MSTKSCLPSRYEIRALEPKHLEWASAIIVHNNIFHSTIWSILYPEDKTRRAYSGLKETEYLVKFGIDSGHSLGVFDLEYQFKRPESAATAGGLYWNTADETASAEALLDNMDFPLVSVAIGYDGFDAVDWEHKDDRMDGLLKVLPLRRTMGLILNSRDKRQPASWKPTHRGEVLFSEGNQHAARLCGTGPDDRVGHIYDVGSGRKRLPSHPDCLRFRSCCPCLAQPSVAVPQRSRERISYASLHRGNRDWGACVPLSTSQPEYC